MYFSHILKPLKLEIHVLDFFIDYNKKVFANSFHKNSTTFYLEYVSKYIISYNHND